MNKKKVEGSPIMIRKTSQSPPGIVPKTPPNLIKPWYTHSFITQVNNPANISPPKTIQQINYQIPTNQASVMIENSSKLFQNEKQDFKKPILNQQKTIKHQMPSEIIQGNQFRKNNFIEKEIKQNQQKLENNKYMQNPIITKYQIGNQQNSGYIHRLPSKISIDQTSDKQLTVGKQTPSFTGYHSLERLQTANYITSQTPSIIIPSQSNTIIQPQSYVLSQSSQNQCNMQCNQITQTNIKEVTKDDCLFCKFQKKNLQRYSPKQSQIKCYGDSQDQSQLKISEPAIISPSVVVLKDHSQYHNTQSHSLSPAHSSLQKPLYVVTQPKVISSQLQKPLDLKEIKIPVNPYTINRSGSAGSRIIDTKPISQPKIFITPSSPQNQNQAMVTPSQNFSQSQANQQNLQDTKNTDNSNQVYSIQSSNIQNNQLQQQNQQKQINQFQKENQQQIIYNFSSSPNSDGSPKSCLQQTFNLKMKQEFSNETDSIRSAICQSPYFKEQQPIQVIPGVESFHQPNSLNSESILTQIHQQTHQPSYLNYLNQNNNNNNISQNSVRSVKCSNSFNKTSSPPKLNETITEPPQSKSSLLIQQLNRMVFEDNNNSNKQSNILSTAPITNQNQKERPPLGTVNLQNEFIKQQSQSISNVKNSQYDQNKFSQILLENQFGAGTSSNLNVEQSILTSQKHNPQITSHFNNHKTQSQQSYAQENNGLKSDEYKDFKSTYPQKSVIQQEQLNFYSQQSYTIQDQIDNQNALNNIRYNQIEQAQQQLLQLKNKQKQIKDSEKLENEEKLNYSNKYQTQEKLLDELRIQSEEQSFDQNKLKPDNRSSIDDKNILEYSFNNNNNNNNYNLKYTECPSLYVFDENQRASYNKQDEKYNLKVNYPFTRDNVREEDQLSRRETIVQILDKANFISQKCVDINNYSLNDIPSIISEKKGDYYFTPASLSPDHPKSDQENMILQEYTYKKKLNESSQYKSNLSTTIKKEPNSIQKENISNSSQRFMNSLEPKVLENIYNASKSHQYEIAQSSINSFNQQ